MTNKKLEKLRKSKDTYFYNLTPVNNETVTLTAHWKLAFNLVKTPTRGTYYVWFKDSDCDCSNNCSGNVCGDFNCNTYGVLANGSYAYVLGHDKKWYYGYIEIKDSNFSSKDPLYKCFDTNGANCKDGLNKSCKEVYDAAKAKTIKYDGKTLVYAKWHDDICCWSYQEGDCSCSTKNQGCLKYGNDGNYTSYCPLD